jgi:hypothetical protein
MSTLLANSIVANSIVIGAIAVSACYAIWRLGPRRMRDALRMRMHKALPRMFAAGAASTSGCDACEGCAPAPNAQAAPAKQEHPIAWRRKSTH